MQLLRRNKQRYILGMLTVFCSLAMVAQLSCKKEEDSERVLSTRDKILGTWRRSLRAYDHNRNGRIDSAEIVRAPETDTIILTLVPNASYTSIQRYKGAEYPVTGTWHLQSDDKEIVFQPSTSTSKVDTCRLDSVSQAFFMKHTEYPNVVHYYEAFVRPR